ncbi:MAG: hypothetical protein ACJA2B_001134 [Candidatus Endobugula sp.]|jgi:hypothetical protein
MLVSSYSSWSGHATIIGKNKKAPRLYSVTPVESVDDHRLKGRCTHSLHDAFMSGFACMFFQDPLLTQFQKRLGEAENSSNLRTLFKMTTIPKDTQLRDIIDNTNSEVLRPIFKDYFERLRRGKHVESFQVLPGQYLCAIDGVYHHSSEQVHCDNVLKQNPQKWHSDLPSCGTARRVHAP